MDPNTLAIGAFGLPVILTIVLGMVYNAFPQVPDRAKPFIAAGCGIGLGILAMFYNTTPPFTYQAWIYHVLYGFLIGAEAVGLYEMSKRAKVTGYKVVDKTTGEELENVKILKLKK
jgi:hypothetical protein